MVPAHEDKFRKVAPGEYELIEKKKEPAKVKQIEERSWHYIGR